MWFDEVDSPQATPVAFASRDRAPSQSSILRRWVQSRNTIEDEVREPPAPPRPLGPSDDTPRRGGLSDSPLPSSAARAPSIPPAIPLPVVESMPPPVSQVDEAVLNNLTAAIRDVRNLQSVLHTELEGQLVLLAAKMAQKVIRRELTTDPTILAQLAREGLQALGDANQVVVRLGALPDPAQTDAVVERLRAEMPEARVIIDEDSAPGACVVEAEMGHVDESVETRLDNVLCDVLGEQVDVLGAPS